MTRAMILDPDRPFPADPATRAIARALYAGVRDLPIFGPRALFDRFGIEPVATTEGPLDPLDHHRAIGASGRGVCARHAGAPSKTRKG